MRVKKSIDKTRIKILKMCLGIFCIGMSLTACAKEAGSVDETGGPVKETVKETVQEEEHPKKEQQSKEEILTLGFAGDVNLDENWPTIQFLNRQENGIKDCIDADIIEYAKSLDLFMLNNEFSYSTGGTAMEGKAYTFRAHPERVEILKTLGTDLVLLANNHVYDYGEEAFYDTLDTLEEAGIPYVGAGRNRKEACQPVYFEKGDIKIAYVAATRAEKFILTPEAGEDSPGVLRAYDEGRYLEVIGEAAKEADYVVASIHFGTEYSNQAEEYQRDLAKEFIDAGADAVIGSHAHVLQGLEYYQGKPIIYSLGNFWFNEKTLNTCILEISISDKDASLKGVRFVPYIQEGCRTRLPNGAEEKEEIIDFMESISFGVTIDRDGNVTEEME